MDRCAKICDLNFAKTQKYVLGFKVSVNYRVVMKIVHGLQDLLQVLGSGFLSKHFVGLPLEPGYLCLELFVDLTVRSILEDHVNLLVVVEHTVEVQNVLVLKVRVVLYLSDHLLHCTRLANHHFVHYLQSHYKVGFLLSCKIDISKPSFTQFWTELKVIFRKFSQINSSIDIEERFFWAIQLFLSIIFLGFWGLFSQLSYIRNRWLLSFARLL